MNAPTILISGASDGIGLALARHYAATGARLLLLGRRPASGLGESFFTATSYCRVDLAQPYAHAIVKRFLLHQGIERLDLLIHNAGLGYYGPLEQQPAATINDMLAVNVHAPIALTHALLPLVERTHGSVVFISSIAANLPVPQYAVYGASKAALDGFARSLRVELAGRARVQVIHPGATRTAMHARSGAPLEKLGWSRFPPPERVARAIARAIASGRDETTIGLGNRMLRWAGRQLEWLGY
ncbi:MAG: SDR family NAD(P)-dependent oxidoreductase [Chloroflexaceae bacterium]|nr:SDR family NAD(P)-dependent oxidoreductase [Chloroflexaceae bacterium]